MFSKQLLFVCLISLNLFSGCTNGQAEEATCPNQEKTHAQIPVLKPEQKPLSQIIQNGKLGFIDNTGRVVIKPQFELDQVAYFSENRAALGGKNGKWGFIDNTGKVIVAPQFENVHQFSEGRAAVKQNGKWGFIDFNGKIIVQPQFNQVSGFSEQRAAVQKGYLWGFIDRDGKFIVKPKFTGYTDFSEGLAGFESYENNQSKTGFIDTSGRVVIELKNVNINIEGLGFTNGLAPVWVRNPGIWGIINGILDETGRGRKFWGYINRSGQIAIPLKYDYAFNFQDCLAAVEKNGKLGYINTSGEMVIQPQFDERLRFSEGLADFQLNQKYGYIDKNGKVVIPPQFMKTFGFSEGLASVQTEGGKWGFINRQGNIVIKPQFDQVTNFSFGLSRVKIGNKYGYIDKKGKYVWNLSN